jgi:hypothetical protein
MSDKSMNAPDQQGNRKTSKSPKLCEDADAGERADRNVWRDARGEPIEGFELGLDVTSGQTPEGYTYEEAESSVSRPMNPELQAILDDARSAGFEVSGDLCEGIFIVKHRAGDVPMGLQVMPDHSAYLVAEPENSNEIRDYAVMRSALGLHARGPTAPNSST